MVWALLPLLFLALIFGFTAIERDLASITPPAAPLQVSSSDVSAASTAQAFVAYRNAAVSYVQQQMLQNQTGGMGEITVGVPAADNLPSRSDAIYVENSSVVFPKVISGVATNNGPGFVVCVWMPVPATMVAPVAAWLTQHNGGDLTFGTVLANDNWQQAGPGGTVHAIPPTCLLVAETDARLPVPVPTLTSSMGFIISVVGLGGN